MRALVTGGASPLGEAIVRRLAAAGHHVTVHAHRNIDAARRLAAEIAGDAICCDLTDIAATEQALRPLLEAGLPEAGLSKPGLPEAGPPQILVHNAGTHDDAPLAGMSELQWRSVIGVTLDGFYAVARPLLLPMLATRWGRIVAISSVSARLSNRGQANYAAAKAGWKARCARWRARLPAAASR